MHITLKSAAVAAGAFVAAAASAQQNGPPPSPSQAQQAPQGPPRRAPQPYSPQPAVTASFAGRNANFTGIVDPANGQLCYLLNVAGIEGASAAKIVTDKGQAAVTLQPPVDGSSGTCASIGADAARALLDHPEQYWVEVDSATYPQAALAPLHAETYG